jgi:DNA-binding transcriptional LysR family regulator
MFELKSLTIFVKVAERRSFAQASRELGITQSGVSNAVARLEERLGVRLLARTTRRVNLTEDGAAFLDRCQRILGELEEAEAGRGRRRQADCASICRYRSAALKSCRCSAHFAPRIPTSPWR